MFCAQTTRRAVVVEGAPDVVVSDLAEFQNICLNWILSDHLVRLHRDARNHWLIYNTAHKVETRISRKPLHEVHESFPFCVVSPLVDLSYLFLPRGCHSSYLIDHNSFDVIHLCTPSDVKVHSQWDSIEIECLTPHLMSWKNLTTDLRVKILNPRLPVRKKCAPIMIIGSYEFVHLPKVILRRNWMHVQILKISHNSVHIGFDRNMD